MARSLKDRIKNKQYAPIDEFKEIINIFSHFRGKKIGDLAGDPRPLLSDSSAFYRTPPKSGFLQGDILSGLPILFTDSGGDPIELDIEHSAMILSNECDAELREKNHQAYIRYCPVYRESLLFDLLEADSNLQGSISANRISEYFRMPDFNGDALVADLSMWCSADLPWVHKTVKGSKKSRVTSLSDDAYYLLKAKLTWLVLRPTVDSKRSE